MGRMEVDMKTNKKEVERRKRLIATVRTLWASLDSHLDYAIENPKRKLKDGEGNRKFHADTAREYVNSMKDLLEDL